jgi:hypothetical protein
VKSDFPPNGMISCPDLGEVSLRIHRRKECTVEPSTTLTDELRHSIWRSAFMNARNVEPGTSVSPVADLTYSRIHFSFLLATNSQQRMRSSARYIFAVNTPFINEYRYIHEGLPASLPCNFSPLKYELNGPFPSLLFFKAI